MRDFHFPGRSPVITQNGMCATSHPLASRTAVQILENGGNAMDAAIAGAVLLGICEPQMTGIGGDCFVLFTPPNEDRVLAMNGSGRAPAALNAENLRKQGYKSIPLHSSDAVTVPGAIDAFCRLSSDWGKLGLAQTLEPAIYYAENGVPVSARTAFDWEIAQDVFQGVAKNYYLPDGKSPSEGVVFRAPNQANVLKRIALEGRDGFYAGEVAVDMVNSLRALGGCHTLDDFAATKCDYTIPVSGTYNGFELVEHAPNGQGATAILLNNILSHFDIKSMSPFGTLRAHIEAEAAKLAHDTRDHVIADPDFTTRLAHMLSPETAKKLAALIDPKRAATIPNAKTEAVHKDTVYITVVDKDRMAVSLIYSIYHSFGSGIASDKFGVLFQNRGAGFNLEAGHPNEAMGGKRPMHTIIPAMLKQHGKIVMPFGVMGGGYQPTGHSRVLSNMTDFGLSPQAAIDAPRCFSDNNILKVERGYDENVRAELAEMGHVIEVPKAPLGGAQSIWINHENGTLHGASDPRKDGAALGY